MTLDPHNRSGATRRSPRDIIVIVIAILTIIAGVGQMLAPGVALRGMGAETTPALTLFFVMASMLVALIGVALLVEGVRPSPRRMMLLWGGIQKLASVAILVVGIVTDVVAPIVGAVCAWDGVCGIALIAIWMKERKRL
jgi:hypothetical protein